MRSYPSHMHVPAAKVGKKEHVVCHQSAQGPHLCGEKVGRHQHVQVRADELLPCGRSLTLGRWRNAMTLEDVTHSLVTHGVSQVGEGADNAIIPPGTILLRHANDQRLQLWINRGASRRLAVLRAVKLLGHEFPVPAKNRVGLDDRG